ncbi:MAG: hypothetical protein EBZ62_03915, partial [Sphingobacteriia bacterium]|nr:hypothetical protein [Sphingobacteriia bacterium]
VDNVLVAVAYADPGPMASAEQQKAALVLLYSGVFLGILAMRFVAQYFVGLMQRYPRLEHSAYLVIGLLGFKLCLTDLLPKAINHTAGVGAWLLHPSVAHWGDLGFSMLTLAIFAWPIAFSKSAKPSSN